MKNLRENNQFNISKILFGNKSDLSDEREVKKEDAENFAKSIGCDYYEGSAMTGININEALDDIARITYLSKKDKIEEEMRNNESIVITKKNHKNKDKEKKKKCC